MKQLKCSVIDIAMMVLILFMYFLVPAGVIIGIIWIIIIESGGINATSIFGILVAAFFVAIICALVGPYDAMD